MKGHTMIQLWALLSSCAVVLVLLVLLSIAQALRVRSLHGLLQQAHDAAVRQQVAMAEDQAKIRELYSAWRAEKAHVEQLQRKLLLLQTMHE